MAIVNLQEQLGILLNPLQSKDKLELDIDQTTIDWWNTENTAGVGKFNEELYYEFKQRRKHISDLEIDLIVRWKKFGKFNWKLYEKFKHERSDRIYREDQKSLVISQDPQTLQRH